MFTLQDLLKLIGSAVASRFSSLLEERSPIIYSQRDRRRGGQFGRRLSNLPEDETTTVPTIHRNAFLWGSANFLSKLPNEMILLAFGRKEAARNSVETILKIPGNEHNVVMLPEDISAIHAHLNAAPNNSVLVVHNHPEHIISTLLAFLVGEDPLPSLKDRNTALRFFYNRILAGVERTSIANIRFFLVQNDDVIEFSGINRATILDVLRIGLSLAAAI
jgi:hypothetical protein